MWNEKEKADQHEPTPMKHYPEICFWCGMPVENEIHKVSGTLAQMAGSS